MNRSAVRSGRFRYPAATPSPPMYSSPGNPTGTGRSAASSTWQAVLAIGTPMLTGSPARTFHSVDQIVVSVGPYMFNTLPGAVEQTVGEVARQGLAAAQH